ncbi:MAG TPA: tRNA lysidine(34) synthetase TilS [Anaerolineae bacterium]|nr:tRNA lysidine(34) synthetase TilS [Anaerolineae bacterium]
MSLIRQVQQTIDAHGLLLPRDTVVLGVSGGPDSLCMLDVLRRLAPTYHASLHVAHLHHGIRGQDADEDSAFVAELCRGWGVPCKVERIDVPALAQRRGLAIEEAARQARYAFLRSCAHAVDAESVAVAHNADDQVETVLMHFLRGAGLAGLRGMRPLAWMDELRLRANFLESPPGPQARIRLIRPLLEVSRQEIEKYCREQGLQPRFDRSNLDQTYFRNRLRHELIPFLETYNPNVRQVLRRTAEVVAADYELLRVHLARTWPDVVRSESDVAITFDLNALRSLPLGLQRSIMREGIHRLRRSLRNISFVHVDDAVRIVREGKVGAIATLPRRLALTLDYEQAILAEEGFEPPAPTVPRITAEGLPVSVPGTTTLPDTDWRVTTRLVEHKSLPRNWPQNTDPYLAYVDASRIRAGSRLTLRPRREGDWFEPLGLRGRRQRLGDYCINAKIPSRERATLPLLVCGEHGEDIVWVVGYRLDARYAVGADTESVLVVRFARG